MSELFKKLVTLSEGKMKKVGFNPNQYAADPIVIALRPGDIERFNAVYKFVINSDLRTIERSKSGAIAKCRENGYAYDILVNRCGARLTIITDGYLFVWRIGRPEFNAGHVKGYEAWRIFANLCKNSNIDLESMALPDGEGRRVKETIERPMIQMLITHTELESVHHIDFHSSYASGLALTHPEFAPIIEKLYAERKTKSFYKDVLNCTIGYMQSISKCGARWAHLSRDAIANNNTRVLALAIQLRNSGRTIIGYNTDGIWYQGDIYHDPRGPFGDEGDGIGKWSNDHVNCKFRAKSDGAYEFIENGVYKPLIRGLTKLDQIKPRSEWEWGDIYRANAAVIMYRLDPKKGIVPIEEEEGDEDEED